jgi:hypothetical protein
MPGSTHGFPSSPKRIWPRLPWRGPFLQSKAEWEAHMSRWRISEHRQKLAVICGLACLAITGPTMGAGSPLDGDYVGKRTLVDGSPSAQCPTQEDVSVTISGQRLIFTNSALKKFGVGFDPAPDGSFDQIYTDDGGTTVFIKGKVAGDSIDGDVKNYSTGCTHHWHLVKQNH